MFYHFISSASSVLVIEALVHFPSFCLLLWSLIEKLGSFPFSGEFGWGHICPRVPQIIRKSPKGDGMAALDSIPYGMISLVLSLGHQWMQGAEEPWLNMPLMSCLFSALLLEALPLPTDQWSTTQRVQTGYTLLPDQVYTGASVLANCHGCPVILQ